MKLRWTRPALEQLDKILTYVSVDDPRAAEKLACRILDRVKTLADHPELGRSGRAPGTRELVIAGTAFIVPYRLKGGHIEILAVFHTSRRWPDYFE